MNDAPLRVTVPGTEYHLVPPHLLPLADDPRTMTLACEALLRDARAPATVQAGLRAASLAGFMLVCLQQPDRAIDLLEHCLPDQRGVADAKGLVATQLRLVQALQAADRAADAVSRADAALDTIAAETGGSMVGLRHFALHHLGKALIQAGNAGRARTVLEEALHLRRQLGAADLVASTEQALALLDAVSR